MNPVNPNQDMTDSKLQDELDQVFYDALRGKTVTPDQGYILEWAELRIKPALRRLLQSKLDKAVREARESERQFLERLKLEFDANVSVDAGEAWSDSDAAEMVDNRLAHLSNNQEKAA